MRRKNGLNRRGGEKIAGSSRQPEAMPSDEDWYSEEDSGGHPDCEKMALAVPIDEAVRIAKELGIEVRPKGDNNYSFDGSGNPAAYAAFLSRVCVKPPLT